MHFKLFEAILDHVFLLFRGGSLFFLFHTLGEGWGGWAKVWKFPYFFLTLPLKNL